MWKLTKDPKVQTYIHIQCILSYLVCELSDPDNFVNHFRKIPANKRSRLLSRSSVATSLKVDLQP